MEDSSMLSFLGISLTAAHMMAYAPFNVWTSITSSVIETPTSLDFFTRQGFIVHVLYHYFNWKSPTLHIPITNIHVNLSLPSHTPTLYALIKTDTLILIKTDTPHIHYPEQLVFFFTLSGFFHAPIYLVSIITLPLRHPQFMNFILPNVSLICVRLWSVLTCMLTILTFI